jgi:hypothetical protein
MMISSTICSPGQTGLLTIVTGRGICGNKKRPASLQASEIVVPPPGVEPGSGYTAMCESALVGMSAALSLGADEEFGADHQAASVGNLERRVDFATPFTFTAVGWICIHKRLAREVTRLQWSSPTKISTTRNATMSRQPAARRSQTFGGDQIPLA